MLDDQGYMGMTTPLASLGADLEHGDGIPVSNADEVFQNLTLLKPLNR